MINWKDDDIINICGHFHWQMTSIQFRHLMQYSETTSLIINSNKIEFFLNFVNLDLQQILGVSINFRSGLNPRPNNEGRRDNHHWGETLANKGWHSSPVPSYPILLLSSFTWISLKRIRFTKCFMKLASVGTYRYFIFLMAPFDTPCMP